MDSRDFDIISYFESRNIQYWTGGRNLSRGWIGITCPFCGDHDYSGNNHCGIHLESKVFKCWICREKGGSAKLISRLEKCSYSAAEAVMSQFLILGIRGGREAYSSGVSAEDSPFSLPPEALDLLPPLHYSFLEQRNFHPDAIIKEYSIKACANLGKWRFRIIIPVFKSGIIVDFTSRDVSGKVDASYKNRPGFDRNLLYNIDSIKRDTVLIVEGPLDVWRMGSGVVSTFGINYTSPQVLELLKKGVKNYFIMYDPEPRAIESAHQLAKKLTLYNEIKHVEVIELSGDSDPADLLESEAMYLRKEIGLDGR